MRVIYLVFNEGYTTTAGPELHRVDLSEEAIRLARMLHAARPEDPEAGGLLALMLLIDARRPARTNAAGDLVPLPEQDRSLWNRERAAEGLALVNEAIELGKRYSTAQSGAFVNGILDKLKAQRPFPPDPLDSPDAHDEEEEPAPQEGESG